MLLDDHAVVVIVPTSPAARIAQELAARGFNADREAVTLIANAAEPERVIERATTALDGDARVLTADAVTDAIDTDTSRGSLDTPDPSSESGDPVEPQGVDKPRSGSGNAHDRVGADTTVTIQGDVTDRSTGTGVYDDFVATFRDRYERLAGMLRGRVNARPTTAIADMTGGSEAACIGMVNDIRSTRNGHRLIELEDTNGTFPALVTKDRDIIEHVNELLLDEVIAVSGRLADDSGILFTDAIHFPDVPRTFQPQTADRHVQAALLSDIHVGSQEFMADAWSQFAAWLHTEEAEPVEYLVIAGDMVEGVGVYPGQDEELDIVDIFEQYRAFAEALKEVPGDLEIVMIPGNHDAVRLAEPQPAFDDDLRSIMAAHDARVTGNPSTVTIEGVRILLYHGVSLDEVIAETPGLTYDAPHEAMYRLLRKRHVAPQYGERTRVAPEDRDFLVIDEVPDVFHAGHVHKLGYGRYRNVTVINSGCWQSQTAFQRRVNIDPDAAFAPILDLDTLDVQIRQF